jgi:hypothetical protein
MAMRIRMTDRRDRLYERLETNSPEQTRSGALDHAAKTYLHLYGTDIEPGAIEELLQQAENEGSLTAAQIADALDNAHEPIGYRSEIDVGRD